DEILVFTQTSLYSWSARDSAWILRDTHLAVSSDELTVFGTNGDEVDVDRAELGNTVVYVWTELGANPTLYVGAVDKTTHAIIMPPTNTGAGASGSRGRLTALSTKILLTFSDASANLVAYPIDPAAVAASISGAATTILAAASFNAYYDVTRLTGADSAVLACRRQTTTAYSVFTISSALATSTRAPGRTCDGPIA